jgi:hypothetical protein
MGVASAISGGLSAGMGIYQTIQGAKEKKQAKEALENYERQKFENIAKDLQVSKIGADRKLMEQSRLASTQVGALKEGGGRTLIGGLGRVEEGNQNVTKEITGDLDQQRAEISQLEARDNANIRGLQENREIADISALSSQYQSGKQDMNMGIGNVLQGVGSVANQFGSPESGVANPQIEAIPNNITPAGVVPLNKLNSSVSSNYLRNPQFNYGGIGMMKPKNRFVNSN